MVLTDASREDWLEGRGPQLTLIGYQDDATSKVVAARFQYEHELTRLRSQYRVIARLQIATKTGAGGLIVERRRPAALPSRRKDIFSAKFGWPGRP